MDGVTAKIAQEIAVFLEHHNIHALPRQEKSEHHSSGTAACDGATGLDGLVHVCSFYLTCMTRSCYVSRMKAASAAILVLLCALPAYPQTPAKSIDRFFD